MPVYIRKNVSLTPPSISRMSEENEDDYLQDPDQLRDVLPQPYRMINNVMNQLFSDVWEIVQEKEIKRLELERKVRPPKYDQPIKLQVHGKATALTNSKDGNYIFIGLPNGFAVVSSHNQQTVGIWEENGAEITRIYAYNFLNFASISTYLIVTLDDMAIARLFLFASNFIFLAKVFNNSEVVDILPTDVRKKKALEIVIPEYIQVFNYSVFIDQSSFEKEEVVPKLLASAVHASLEGDYVGVVFENDTNDTWLEVHRIPRELWIKELETSDIQFNKERVLKDTEESFAMTSMELATSHFAEEGKKPEASKNRPGRFTSKKAKSPGRLEQQLALSPSLIKTQAAVKFTSPNLVLKVKPLAPYSATVSTSTFSLAQKADTGEVLGTGQMHIMSAAHLHSRDSTFQHMHSNLIKYLPQEDTQTQHSVMEATFHFLNPGRISLPGDLSTGQKDEDEEETPFKEKTGKLQQKKGESTVEHEEVIGLDKNPTNDQPCSVAVWWSGSKHLLQFSLLKSSKDLEHKPDVVWPFSCNITASAISSCTSHIAIGLENGNVVIWDLYLGIQRGVVNMSATSSLRMLHFVDPSIYPTSRVHYPPYGQQGATYLLAQCQDSTQYLYDIGHETHDQPVCIEQMPEADDEIQTLLEYVPDLPQLAVVVQKDGRLYLKDIQTGVKVCQLSLPATYHLASPWEPIMAFGGCGQLLFVKGNGVEVNDAGETNDVSGLFVYTLRSFPTLDKYWAQTRYEGHLSGHSTAEQRLDALMKERFEQQALRKQRLQSRWNLLRSDLEVLQSTREMPVNPVNQRFMI